jgi:hypothetical protein
MTRKAPRPHWSSVCQRRHRPTRSQRRTETKDSWFFFGVDSPLVFCSRGLLCARCRRARLRVGLASWAFFCRDLGTSPEKEMRSASRKGCETVKRMGMTQQRTGEQQSIPFPGTRLPDGPARVAGCQTDAGPSQFTISPDSKPITTSDRLEPSNRTQRWSWPIPPLSVSRALSSTSRPVSPARAARVARE